MVGSDLIAEHSRFRFAFPILVLLAAMRSPLHHRNTTRVAIHVLGMMSHQVSKASSLRLSGPLKMLVHEQRGVNYRRHFKNIASSDGMIPESWWQNLGNIKSNITSNGRIPSSWW